MILDIDNTVDHPEVIITVHHSSSSAGKILSSKKKINSDAFLMSASQGKYSVKISDSNLFPLMLGQVRLIKERIYGLRSFILSLGSCCMNILTRHDHTTEMFVSSQTM